MVLVRRLTLRIIAGLLAAAGMLAACATPPAPPPPPTRGLTATQMAALRELGFQPGDGTWEFGMSDKLLFGVNESRLADGQAANIARIARTLLSVDIRRGRVEGHTDDTGAAAYNDALSQRRAAAVAEAMIAAGMQRQDIVIEGAGARRPIEDNRSAGGRRENRRVVIVVDAE